MAFIGIKIPQEVARLFRGLDIPGEKVPENDYHVTILCFESNYPIKQITKVTESAFEVIKNTEPFTISFEKITCFPKREDNPCPIIIKVNSKELHKLNSSIKKEFDSNDIEYLKTFKDYKPHMTLSYADEEIKDIKLKSKIEFTVTEIVLWAGDDGDDRFFITFPLKGFGHKKHSHLLQNINLFYKLSGKV